MLPTEVLAEPESVYAALIDDLIEKVWPQDGPIPWQDPDEYRLIVERLDCSWAAGRRAAALTAPIAEGCSR